MFRDSKAPQTLMNLQDLIRDVADFPQPGILFRDITPLLQDPLGLQATITQMAQALSSVEFDLVVGIESRGFIFGVPLAHHLQLGFIPVRKPGKLPPPVLSHRYSLEYGSDTLEIRQHLFTQAQRVVIVDDLIATGGTAAAAAKLVEQAGGQVQAFAFVVELAGLKGRQHLPAGIPVKSLITYDDS